MAHTPWEDAQAYVLGASLCAFGVLLLQSTGLVTGQTAGLGVLLSYATDIGFGWWFFAVNLPFYVLGWYRMGRGFVVRTAVAVTLVSVLSAWLPTVVTMGGGDPWAISFLAGAVIGMGLMVIFRHGASLGGVGILALWLQERFAIRAGWVQLAFDLTLFAAALALLPAGPVMASVLGAVVTNLIIAGEPPPGPLCRAIAGAARPRSAWRLDSPRDAMRWP